jgi:hypothetical protein
MPRVCLGETAFLLSLEDDRSDLLRQASKKASEAKSNA